MLALLAGAPLLPTLERLEVTADADMCTELLARIVGEQPHLSQIHVNVVNHTPAAFAALLRALGQTPRQSLSFRGMGIGDEAIDAIAEQLPELVELDLRFNNVGPAGIEALARSKAFGKLRALYLDREPLGDSDERWQRALIESPQLQNLERLDLRRSSALLRSPRESVPALRERFGHVLVEERPGKFHEPRPSNPKHSIMRRLPR